MINVVLYSKPNCSFCNKAKNLLNFHNISYDEKILDIDFTREYILSLYSQAKTFPVVVIDGVYIGGFIELQEYIRNNSINKERKDD
jgi:glutaredoxin